ncbi:MAG: insulinase family protein [Hyphomicrobiales bacterium]|nr:insulinase family protein [Hyphomicrobiales bacterium]MBV8827324.1 insulinase family protein [Hyphomicrobiales bacterium]
MKVAHFIGRAPIRSILLIASAFALAVAAHALPGPAQTAQAASVAHYTLTNGLELVVIPDHRAPVVTHMIWYKVGSADETPGQSGLAHFLEHLMFKGTAKNPAGRFSQTLATIGGQENAFTSNDFTAFFQRTSREHLASLMEFEADRMTGLVLTDENVLPELQVVLEEWNMRVGNDPGARLGEQVTAALYLNHPYHRPVIGWRNEIVKLTREDALAFYRRFYTPNNAVVVVAGDVSAEEAKQMAEATYGKVAQRAAIGPRVRPGEPQPEPSAVRHLVLADQRVAQASLQRSYLVPSIATAQPGEAEAIEVLVHALGSGSTSRLYRELIAEKGLAADAGAWYQDASLDMSRLGVYGTPRPGVTLHQLEDAIDGVIAEVIEKGLTPEEIERAKNRMIAAYVYAQDNQSSLARLYGAALTTGSSVEEVQSRPERLRAVTAEAVNAAARHWLDSRRSVTGYLVHDLKQSEEKRS